MKLKCGLMQKFSVGKLLCGWSGVTSELRKDISNNVEWMKSTLLV